jgi:hypothetical protein
MREKKIHKALFRILYDFMNEVKSDKKFLVPNTSSHQWNISLPKSERFNSKKVSESKKDVAVYFYNFDSIYHVSSCDWVSERINATE